jgi:hypothetical protein
MAYIRKIAEGNRWSENLRCALRHGDKRRSWVGLLIEAMTLRTEGFGLRRQSVAKRLHQKWVDLSAPLPSRTAATSTFGMRIGAVAKRT